MKDKTNCEFKDHFHYIGEYRDAMDNIYYLKYIVPIGCNYDYHFFIKKFAEKRKKQFTCLRENTGKYITFTFPIEKKVT